MQEEKIEKQIPHILKMVFMAVLLCNTTVNVPTTQKEFVKKWLMT